MDKTFNIYKNGEKVANSEVGEGGASYTVDGLTPNTSYEAGTFQVSFSNEAGESGKVDVPAFTTKPIAVTGVTVAPKTTTVEPGKARNLSVTVEPENASDKTVSYTSSDEAVATVDGNGKITGVKDGLATVTVTTNDGNKTADVAVTVKTATVAVESVSVDPTTLSLEEGATATLNATVAPSNASYKAVRFTSSDDAIATVDNNGLVTAVAPGSVDITVESLMDGSKTVTCVVTVTAPAK